MTKKHSKLGASASDRWINCPGSIRQSEGAPNVQSAFALEGTAAHEVCELLLHGKPLPAEIKGIAVSDEMVEHCNVYVELVRDRSQSEVPGVAEAAEVDIEQRFHLSELHPDFFGTADCVIYRPAEKRLIVIDFKYGRGIPVEAKGNPQLRYYALGAALKKHNRGVSIVETVIVQPRCPHPDGPIRSDEISAMDLLDWSADLVNAAKATAEPDAPLNPGDWCEFCPAAATCPALRERVLARAQADFAEDGTLHLSNPESYDLKALWEILPYADQFEDWIRRVRELAHHEAEAGRCDPGWKLVATRATRKWKDEDAAVSALRGLVYEDDDLFTKKFKSPAQVEKVLSKSDKPKIKELVESVSSGTVLAPIDDPRPAVKPDAQAEFSAIE